MNNLKSKKMDKKEKETFLEGVDKIRGFLFRLHQRFFGETENATVANILCLFEQDIDSSIAEMETLIGILKSMKG